MYRRCSIVSSSFPSPPSKLFFYGKTLGLQNSTQPRPHVSKVHKNFQDRGFERWHNGGTIVRIQICISTRPDINTLYWLSGIKKCVHLFHYRMKTSPRWKVNSCLTWSRNKWLNRAVTLLQILFRIHNLNLVWEQNKEIIYLT